MICFEPSDNVHYSSAIASRSLVEKKEDPGDFTILCTIRSFNFTQDLCDLGNSINLISMVVYKKFDLGLGCTNQHNKNVNGRLYF